MLYEREFNSFLLKVPHKINQEQLNALDRSWEAVVQHLDMTEPHIRISVEESLLHSIMAGVLIAKDACKVSTMSYVPKIENINDLRDNVVNLFEETVSD